MSQRSTVGERPAKSCRSLRLIRFASAWTDFGSISSVGKVGGRNLIPLPLKMVKQSGLSQKSMFSPLGGALSITRMEPFLQTGQVI
jgi:hypothetical protein